MRRLFRGVLLGLIVTTSFAVVLASAARGQTAGDDVSVAVALATSPTPNATPGLNFKILADVASGSGLEQAFTLTIGLPAGLRWGADGPDPGEGCTGTQPAVCRQTMQRNSVGTVGGGWTWDVVAERAGSYEITAAVEPERPDPNPSNNTFTLRFEVRQATTGGSGSGSAVAASAVKLSPAKPRAGSIVVATVRVTADGTAVRPSKIKCAGTIAGVRVPATGRAGSGSATCVYRTPKTAKGRTLRGAISFTARGRSITRRFALRLG